MHWARVQRHGSPFVVKNLSGLSIDERWARSTERREDGCLGYTGTIRSVDGHGAWWTNQTGTVLAHRWIWEHVNGTIPDGMTLDHECHNAASWRGECAGGPTCPHRSCVDVDHMTVKPRAENTLASANHYGNRTHCKRGHEFTEANTYLQKGGGRACRTCHRIAERNRQQRLRSQERPGHGQ